jgi:hypothetical protein
MGRRAVARCPHPVADELSSSATVGFEDGEVHEFQHAVTFLLPKES